MAKEKNKPASKATVLKELRSLNPRPELVTCAFFRKDSFFDSRDLVQVKYEMLRQVDKEGVSIAQASKEFGMSRPAFYQAKADFEIGGLPALVGQKRGPRKPHKISEEILSFIEREVTTSGITSSTLLAGAVEKIFKIKVHPRSIERALKRKKKTKQVVDQKEVSMSPHSEALITFINEKYEQTRSCAFKTSTNHKRPDGFASVVRNGLLAWTNMIIDGVHTRRQSPAKPDNHLIEIVSGIEMAVANILLNRLGA